MKKTTALASIALIATLGLTACGDDSKPAAQGEEQTAPAPSAEMTADNFVQRINDAQYKAGSATMLMEMSMMGMDMTATAEMVVTEKVEDLAMHMSMDVPGTGGSMEMIMIGTSAYLKMAEVTGEKFAELPQDQMGAMGLDDFEAQTNPGAQLELYEKALTDFTVGDKETIDGVETTKYTLSLDTKKVLESEGDAVGVEEALELLGDTMTYVMYIDSNDLPKRITMNLGGGDTTITFSDWGKKLDIVAPAEDQLVDLAF